MLPALIGKTDPDNYQRYLDEKISAALQTLRSHAPGIPDPQIVPSPPEFYRMRCEFAVFKQDDGEFKYAMYIPGTKPRERVLLTEFRAAHPAINQGMAALRSALKHNAFMRNGLFEIDFLAAQDGQLVCALNYHRTFSEAFKAELTRLRSEIRAGGLNAELIARAKKQKIVCERDSVVEHYALDGRTVDLIQVEGTFSQPNAAVCTQMINFARTCAQSAPQRDLLELYCGSGTFTVSLADLYRQVLATEVARVPTQTALNNIALNKLDNVRLCRLSAAEAASAIARERPFKRLLLNDIHIEDYDFTTLLVDPPRAGIQDAAALAFAAQFPQIIYISCNPETLALDLKVLSRTHDIVKLSFFDQFPYTPHLESGVLLRRR